MTCATWLRGAAQGLQSRLPWIIAHQMSTRCRSGNPPSLYLAFNLKCWPFPHVYLHHANRVTSDAGVPVSSAARLPPPVLRQH